MQAIYKSLFVQTGQEAKPIGEADETCIKCHKAKSSSVQNTWSLFEYVGLYFGLRLVDVEAFWYS